MELHNHKENIVYRVYTQDDKLVGVQAEYRGGAKSNKLRLNNRLPRAGLIPTRQSYVGVTDQSGKPESAKENLTRLSTSPKLHSLMAIFKLHSLKAIFNRRYKNGTM